MAENEGTTTETVGATSPAEGQATGSQKTTPETVPYARFSETIAEKNALKAKLEAYESAKTQAEQKAMEEQGKYKELLEGLKPKAEQAEKYEALFSEMVAKTIESIPEEKRSLIPASLSIAEKFAYIEQNRAFLLSGEVKKTVGVGNPTSVSSPSSSTVYTTEQLADGVFYSQNRADILKAQKEGRIR